MDLIENLSSQLQLDGGQARGLAGSLLGMVKDGVAEKLGGDAAASLASAVPELGEWKQDADALAGQPEPAGGGLGDLLSAGMSALGGQQAQSLAPVVSLLGKVGVDAGKAQLVAPMLMNFLQSRVDGGLMQKITSALPWLGMLTGSSSGATEASSGGLGSMLGGMLGGD